MKLAGLDRAFFCPCRHLPREIDAHSHQKGMGQISVPVSICQSYPFASGSNMGIQNGTLVNIKLDSILRNRCVIWGPHPFWGDQLLLDYLTTLSNCQLATHVGVVSLWLAPLKKWAASYFWTTTPSPAMDGLLEEDLPILCLVVAQRLSSRTSERVSQ